MPLRSPTTAAGRGGALPRAAPSRADDAEQPDGRCPRCGRNRRAGGCGCTCPRSTAARAGPPRAHDGAGGAGPGGHAGPSCPPARVGDPRRGGPAEPAGHVLPRLASGHDHAFSLAGVAGRPDGGARRPRDRRRPRGRRTARRRDDDAGQQQVEATVATVSTRPGGRPSPRQGTQCVAAVARRLAAPGRRPRPRDLRGACLDVGAAYAIERGQFGRPSASSRPSSTAGRHAGGRRAGHRRWRGTPPRPPTPATPARPSSRPASRGPSPSTPTSSAPRGASRSWAAWASPGSTTPTCTCAGP